MHSILEAADDATEHRFHSAPVASFSQLFILHPVSCRRAAADAET